MKKLNDQQRTALESIFRQSATEASRSLSSWLGRDVRVAVDPLEQLPFASVTELMGNDDETVCACCMRISGRLSGHLALSFDDASGLSLCAALLDAISTEGVRPAVGEGSVWGELEISAATETANIVGCAFLNALAVHLPSVATADGVNGDRSQQRDGSCLPSPPIFVRDYAAAIMEFLVLDQALECESVLVAKTHFSIDRTPVSWQLLLIPDEISWEGLTQWKV
jgi:chemotaxis protein CheC